MSEFKISETPWTAVKPGDSNGYWHINGKHNGSGAIATCYGVLEEATEANAKLIAAAPDLLEALSAVVEHAKELGLSYDVYDKAEAAIKKATEL